MRRDGLLMVRRVLMAVVVVGGLACSGGGGTVPPEGRPSVSIVRTSALSATVTRGGTATYDFSVTRGGGYDGPVQLVAENLPAGVAAAFTPASLGSGQATAALSLSVSTGAAPGTFPVTVRATGSGVTAQSLSVELIILPPSIVLTVDPEFLDLPTDTDTDTTVAVTLRREGGYSGTVFLSVEDPLPFGVFAEISPAVLPNGVTTSTLMVHAGSAAYGSNGSVRVKAIGDGGIQADVGVNVRVPLSREGVRFRLGHQEYELFAGDTATRVFIIDRLNGYKEAVMLHFEDAPPGITGSFDPNPLLALQSILRITVSSSMAPGTYCPTIRLSGFGINEVQVQMPLIISSPP